MAAKKSKDPFKTREKADDAGVDTIRPNKLIAVHVDKFRGAQAQAKHFEGEATINKDAIMAFSSDAFANRVFEGKTGSFKVLGLEEVVTFVASEASAGLTEEDHAAIREKWGSSAAEELVVRDLGSIRFDAEALEAHYDQVVAALQVLPKDVLEQLFKPMLLKVCPGVLTAIKRHAATPRQIRELTQMLKVRTYIR